MLVIITQLDTIKSVDVKIIIKTLFIKYLRFRIYPEFKVITAITLQILMNLRRLQIL